ncbi:hypothetical protein AOC19_05580 [Polynucleobacter asymbioticus]|uniref:hypothetical protein n=1 Tax=Polynucleobacter asymbioticus TaxID=576611 RepID=UPI001BFE407E|nr:hypothetical protein [Polynucleobacter asymbioticus]QWD84642.1 hypothetical protein AOC19_05580 [Polynucleobacter asymbioticus]
MMALMLRKITLLVFALGLSACGRETYTTWSCIDGAGSKSTMILKKAQMQFQDLQYAYCGSLGPLSYFDLKCSGQIQESSQIFTPGSGKLVSNGKELKCNAL